MTDEKLEKATDLNDSMKALRDIRRAFCTPYPEVLCVRDPGDSYTVSFFSLDDATQTEIKKLLVDYIDRRFEELKKEYEEL